MKRILFLILLAVATPLVQTSCSTPPTERVVVVQSLLFVGHAAEDSVALSAKLYQAGTISPTQARVVLDFYNQKFQPAYRLAVATSHNELDTLANPEVWGLFNQLYALVQSYQKP